MLVRLIWKEIVAHLLSLRFSIAFILLIVLVFAGGYVSIREYKYNVDGYHARSSAHQAELRKMLKEEEDWSRFEELFWWRGKCDAVPVSSLSWLGQGLQPSYPASINFKADKQTRAIRLGMLRNPLRGLLRIPDTVYVVSVVLSFLALLFMFDAVCGEKETGTLRLMLSNAVPRHTVLLGKWVGGIVVVLVPFLLVTAGLLVFAYGQGVLLPSEIGRISILVAIACVYVTVFLNIGLCVSTFTDRSAAALLACLLIWVLSILVIPNMAPVTARILEPTPPLETIRAEKRAVDQEINLKIERLSLISGELAYGQKILDAEKRLESERARRKERWGQYYSDSLARQMSLAQTLGRLSPSGCWTYAALALTKSGPGDLKLLEDARDTLAQEFDRLRLKLDERRKSGGRRPPDGWADIAFEEIPQLRKKSLTTVEAVNSALNDVLILAIVNVVFFMLGFMKFLRYEV